MTLDDMPIEGKPVTWLYCAGVLAEAICLLAFGWLMLNALAVVNDAVHDMRAQTEQGQ